MPEHSMNFTILLDLKSIRSGFHKTYESHIVHKPNIVKTLGLSTAHIQDEVRKLKASFKSTFI